MTGGTVSPPAAISGECSSPSLRRTKLFWDIDTTPLPNWDHSLLPNIEKALAAAGLTKDILKTGWCTHYPPKPTDAIDRWTSHRGIYGNARPDIFDDKEATFRSFLINILFNHDDDDSLVNYVLISGNSDFFWPLYLLRERGHNIVVERPSTSPAANILDQVSTIVWNWEDLVLGRGPLPPALRTITDGVPSQSLLMTIGVGSRICKYEAGEWGKRGSYPTVVWWDMDNNPPLRTIDPGSIVENIEKALRTARFSETVRVHAYGDKNKLNCSVWDQLVQAGGATYTHLPTDGDRDASINIILMDMAISIRDNPPPANYFLISSDYKFISFLDQLSNDDYDVYVSRSSATPSELNLCDYLWHWEDLIEGGPIKN